MLTRMIRIMNLQSRVLVRATLSFIVVLGLAAPVSALAIGSDETSIASDSNGTSEITVNSLAEDRIANEGRDVVLTDEQIQEALRQGTEGMPAITEPYADVFRSAPDEFYGDLALDDQNSLNLLSAPDTKRLISIEGANRYATAARIVQKAFPDEQSLTSGWAIVASGESWPDALAATALAGGLDCPILLTNKDILPAETEDELIRLGVDKVIIVGGNEVVSDAVRVALSDNGNRTVLRLSGDNRYQTAEAIFTYGKTAGVGGSSLWDDTAIVASGVTFADALAISPIAFSQKMPIVLASEFGDLRSSTLQCIEQSPELEAFVLTGGVTRISDETEQTLEDLARQRGTSSSDPALRLAGENRYQTSADIANWAVAEYGFSWNGYAVASGINAPDALAGSVLQGRNKAVLLLVSPSSLPSIEAIGSAVDSGEIIEQAQVFGGLVAVSNRTRKAIAIESGFTIQDIEGYKIYAYLDAGHGPNGTGNGLFDPGAIGSGYKEYELNAELVTLVAGQLADKWPITFRPNVDGGPYYLRDDEAVALGCDFIVSIHFNAMSGMGDGTESYISESTPHPDSYKLQSRMHTAVVSALGLRDLGQKVSDFAIISNQRIPAVLLEVCFIDCADDINVYQAKKADVATAVATAILDIQSGTDGIDTWH